VLSAQQATTLKANFKAIIQELGPIQQAVVSLDPARKTAYDAFMQSLNQFV
jgi:hypothetical protein